MNALRYTTERDKAFGVAGMAIAVTAYDAQGALAEVSLDAPAGHSVAMGSEFFFNGNPRLSAKIAWNEQLRQFRVAAGMVVANIVCRHYVQHHTGVPAEVQQAVRKTLSATGAESEAALEPDEVEAVVESNIRFFDRLFRLPAAHQVATRLADELERRRTLSGAEVTDIVAPLVPYM